MDLYHKIYGQGDPVLILHGFLGMSDNWLSFAKQLAEDYMVILIDLRNHGRSPHTKEFTYRMAAEDVATLCENNWIHSTSVIGHSMGGKVAMQLASDFPDLLEKLIVVDIAPVKYTGGHEHILSALNEINLLDVTNRGKVESALMNRLNDISIVRFLLKNLSREKRGGFRWKMNLPDLITSYPNIIDHPDLDQIETPTLFVKGGNSDYISEADESIIRELFSNAVIKEIPDAGHWVHADNPTTLLELVKSHLVLT